MTLQKPSIPAAAPRHKKRKHRKKYRGLWFERLMALLALVNLGLVALDLSYIRFRDFYLQQVPEFTQWYGAQFKGIEPHRSTEAYLDMVDALEDQVAQTGLQSPGAQALLLELQQLSRDMIDEDPFQVANKSGTLERIKNRMRDRVDEESSKDAFTTFWSETYLSEAGWSDSIGFFNSDVRPLIETNYFRGLGVDGEPADLFWQIDIWFVAIFALEYLARTFYLSRRYKGTSWLDTLLWRWYDLFLLIPFWRWLRVIPVTIRMNQAQLLDLNPLSTRISRGILASVAVELTEIVVVRVINQAQNSLKEGELIRALVKPGAGPRYVDINGIDEVKVISQRLTQVLVYGVLPRIRPEVDALLQHTLKGAIASFPLYQNLKPLPGIVDWSEQLTQQLAHEVSGNAYGAIKAALEDEVGAELTQKLVQQAGLHFREEIQQDRALEEIQLLVTALLDEVKFNYVERLAEEDYESLREETERLYEITTS